MMKNMSNVSSFSFPLSMQGTKSSLVLFLLFFLPTFLILSRSYYYEQNKVVIIRESTTKLNLRTDSNQIDEILLDKDEQLFERVAQAEDTGKVGFSFTSQDELLKVNDICRYWVNKVANYSTNIINDKRFIGSDLTDVSNPMTIKGVQVKSGLGDRLSGLIAVLNHAIDKSKPFTIFWQGFDVAFELNNKFIDSRVGALVPRVPYKKFFPSRTKKYCEEATTHYKCNLLLHEKNHCPVYARACVQGNFCKEMLSEFSEREKHEHQLLTMSEVIGCPLRLLVTPNDNILNFAMSWIIGGQIKNGSLQNLLDELLEYRIISVHLRMGDWAFSHGLSDEILTPVEAETLHCLGIVEHDINNNSQEKEVRWLIASDDPKVRDHFQQNHPSKVIIIQHKPHHMDHVNRLEAEEREFESESLFAEWIVIGRGEELITNEAHDFGVSSFSRLSWLYNLKHSYYSLNTKHSSHTKVVTSRENQCIKKNFEYVGNLALISPVCKNEESLDEYD